MRKIDRRGENRCADFPIRVVRDQNAVAKVDRTSMKNLVSKCEKHSKTWLGQNPGCNFVWENENRCADFTTRGRQDKTQGARIARASKKNYGPRRRDYCKNHIEPKNWGPAKDHLEL